jgi:hypothetical protein
MEGVAEDQPAVPEGGGMSTGWECPVCKTVWAPSVLRCQNNHGGQLGTVVITPWSPVQPGTTTTGNDLTHIVDYINPPFTMTASATRLTSLHSQMGSVSDAEIDEALSA